MQENLCHSKEVQYVHYLPYATGLFSLTNKLPRPPCIGLPRPNDDPEFSNSDLQ